MAFYVGTSGFSYKEWKGNFYPEKMKEKDMLAHYAQHLSAVEINNTFYRMPRREVLTNWSEITPDDFRFIIKASRRITHFKHLKDADEPMRYLFQAVEVLGDKLGAILFQLPPNMRCDLDRLQRFVELVPNDMPVSFEFRNPSWFDDDVLDCLRSRNMSVCFSDSDTLDLPFVSTADWGYLRLRRPAYDEQALRGWQQAAMEAKWRDALVFFKHEDDGAGPALAGEFLELVRSS
jgi:uncharacterized protein YecE (DUF72 family)